MRSWRLFCKARTKLQKKNVWLHPAPQGSTQVQDCCPCLTVVEASILRRFAPLSSELPRNYKGTPCKECRSWKWWLMDVDGVMFFESRGVYFLFFFLGGGHLAISSGARATWYPTWRTWDRASSLAIEVAVFGEFVNDFIEMFQLIICRNSKSESTFKCLYSYSLNSRLSCLQSTV